MSTSLQYVGVDAHKKVIAYRVKTKTGKAPDEGTIKATREALSEWVSRRKQPWVGDVTRFRTLRHAISYCGLCSAQDSSAGSRLL